MPCQLSTALVSISGVVITKEAEFYLMNQADVGYQAGVWSRTKKLVEPCNPMNTVQWQSYIWEPSLMESDSNQVVHHGDRRIFRAGRC